MGDDKVLAYETLVNKWSAIFKKKIGDLFTLEELKQEAWLSVLSALEGAEEVENEPGYIVQSIKNNLIKMIGEAIKNQYYSDHTESANFVTPEDVLISKELYSKLDKCLDEIPYAAFILQYVDSKSVREIAKIAEAQGIKISKSYVHKVINLIKDKMLEE